jgi:hypothetical protein
MTTVVAQSGTAESPAEMKRKEFDFFALPRQVQDRVVASLNGKGVPEVIAYQPSSRWLALRWLWLAGLSSVALVPLSVWGFGQLSSPHALQHPLFAAAYIGLSVLAACSLAVYSTAQKARVYPFALGTYLLPVGVVDVTSAALTTTPLTDLRRVTASGKSHVSLEFGSGGVFEFPLPVGSSVEQLTQELDAHASQLRSAYGASDRRTLATLDPLRDSGFSNPLSSRATISRPRNSGVSRVVLAALLGAVVGGGLFLMRNRLGERTLYLQAVEQNTQDSYRAYLAAGGARDDVIDTRLPRAELLSASGDLAAVEKYAAEHQDSKIRDEVHALLRLELLKELQRARSTQDLAAIEAFKEKHAGFAVVEADLLEARKDVFARALKAFEGAYQPAADAQAFIRSLLAYAERNGPTVEIRFRRESPASVERADSAIRRSAYFTGSKAIPSQYFTGVLANERESRAATAVAEALQQAFSPSVLKFVVKPSEEGTADPPPTDKPTLFVNHKTEMSGGYTTNRPRGVYVGLGMMFQVVGVLPPAEAAFRFKDSSWLPPDINEISKKGLRHEQVYEANAREGFDRFVHRLVERMLGPKGVGFVKLKK